MALNKNIETESLFFVLVVGLIFMSLSIADAQVGDYQVIGNSINTQYYSPGSFSGVDYTSPSIYWPGFDKEVCRERQDFIVQVAPGGCEPAVVRSDLLEERNVPVFCKIMLIQTNPLIDVSRVKSITFPGERPEGVAGITYFPPRFDLRQTRDLADTPIDDNMGYFVVNLKRQDSEDDMPDWVGGNLTAVIDYDVEGALGIGRTSFYVSELSSEDWLRYYKQYSFWNGKGYIKTESIESDRVSVSVYRDFDSKMSSVTLKKGETSSPIYLGGFYCAAGLKVKVEDIMAPVEAALLQVDDQQIWVAKGDRILDNKCLIEDVDAYAGGGKVSVSCSVQDGRFDLRLNPGKITLEIDGNQVDYRIGEEIIEGENIYLGYVGTWGKEDKKKEFAVFVSDPWAGSESGFAYRGVYSIVEEVITKENADSEFSALQDKIKDKILREYSMRVRDSGRKMTKEYISVIEGNSEGSIGSYIINNNDVKASKTYKIKLSEVTVIKNKEWEEDEPSYEYYKEAIKNYRDLVDFYPYDKRIDDDYFEPYAAEALYLAASLAKEFNMSEDREEFLSRLYKEYPDSAWTRKAESDKQRLLKYDSSEAKAVVNLRDRGHFIDLLDFKKPTEEELSVDLLIDGKSERVGLDGILDLKDKASLQVLEIDDNDVKLSFTKPSSGTAGFISRSTTLDLDKNQQTVFEDITVRLVNINMKKQAKLVLDSEVRGPRAYANFSFKIGIEKRGIKLSPEKTEEMMVNIQESIEQWGEVNEKLGKVVKGLKGACFATSAILMAKNMFEGFSGKSLARKEIMTKAGGWNDYCEKIVSSGEQAMNGEVYSSVQKCLLGHNSNIEKDIGIYANYIEETNDKLEQARQGLVNNTNILDFEGQVTDRLEMERRFKEEIRKECYTWGNIELPKKGDESMGNLNKDFCEWGSFEDMKDISTLYSTLNNPGASKVLKDATKTDLAKTALNAQNYHDWEEARVAAEEEAKNKGLGVRATLLDGDRITLANIKTLTNTDISTKYSVFGSEDDILKTGNKVMRVFIPASESFQATSFTAISDVKNAYTIVKLKEDDKGIYSFEKAYTIDGKTNNAIDKDVKDYLGLKKATQFKESNAKAYENKMANPGKLQVKYFDRAPYKGLPAEVPFDVNNGWYVKMEYILSGFGKPYDESGRAVNYYICNVGGNGVIEFKQKGDDICRYYNGISEELGFPGMDAGKSRELVGRAKQALVEASRYYGKEDAIINGRKFSTGISFGGEAGRCSDFMSPSDCNIMFNVCDPVICPSSRCDLGGEFPVDNVIQTGIIGSLVLCLPNFKEGIYIPVCLSGVHAGIDSYLSILKAHRDCLNESLETGRHIGICDEIKSIYLCEFFWKQLVPFADIIIPRLIESFFSQGVRGGGEYLTVQSAWDNTQSAIDYFKNDYAINSMEAFTHRSTEEAGTEICKSFVSTTYPTDFDLLTEPDSPVQYHAWFDENVLTTATPYPTSHYKVYYHIYAGNDRGAYYVVYLKDIPDELASVYVYTSETYVVDRGYLAKGAHVDEARDFIAPSGYKQLCLNINGQDECDFGKVSTSFAINYISDQYAKEQAEQQITTSRECVAGTPSLLSLAQPNLQAGAEEFAEPELYNQGIVRVCSTYNPGKQVSAKEEYDTTNSTYDRWKEVGYCDDPLLKCWLDTDSVKNVIQNKEIETQVLHEVDTSVIGAKDYLTPKRSREIASDAEEFIENIAGKIKKGETRKEVIENEIKTTVEELDELAYLAPSSSHRARGFLLLGRLYGEIVKIIKPETSDNRGAVITSGGGAAEKPVPEGGTETAENPVEKPEEKIIVGTTEWTDSMLEEDVVISMKKLNPYAESLYKYEKGKWYNRSQDGSWILEEGDLKELGYLKGVGKLVELTTFLGGYIKVEKITIMNIGNTDKEMLEKVLNILKK